MRISLVFACLLLNAVTVSAQESAAIQLLSTARVSDRFRRETKTAGQSVPPVVWKTLGDAGWKVQLAEFVVDAAPSLRGVRPPGWPRHLTWDNSDAIHLPKSKLLVLAEKRRNRTGKIVPSSRVAGVLRHEIGHAFDMAAGSSGQKLSASPQFVRAYQQDTSRIVPSHRESLGYYLQGNRIGLEETFAEAFAVSLGGGSSDIEATAFESHFSQVMAYTQKSIVAPNAPSVLDPPSRVTTSTPLRRRLIRKR
ncbi:MAG: hypothetical protein H8E66_02190 [Planctomycetes bacterium]|nr:hypothetical protein [Planctomycetota bacterium]